MPLNSRVDRKLSEHGHARLIIKLRLVEFGFATPRDRTYEPSIELRDPALAPTASFPGRGFVLVAAEEALARRRERGKSTMEQLGQFGNGIGFPQRSERGWLHAARIIPGDPLHAPQIS